MAFLDYSAAIRFLNNWDYYDYRRKKSATQKTRIEPSDTEFSDKTRELKTKPAPDILQKYPDLSISIAPPI